MLRGRLILLGQWVRCAAQLALAASLLVSALAGTAQTTPAPVRFIEETDSAGLQVRFEGDFEFQVGGGVASFDCDDDGLPEVFVTGGVSKSKLYRNRSSRGGPIKCRKSARVWK